MKLPTLVAVLIWGSTAWADLPTGIVFFTEDAACPTGSEPVADAGGRILAVAPAP